MLYCPKCQQTYEEGVQRFCSNEGERLLPAQTSSKSIKQTEGVFTSILNRRTDEADDKFSSPAGFPKNQSSKFSSAGFRPPTDSKIFISEENVELELEPQAKPFPSIFKPDEILIDQEYNDENKTETIDEVNLSTGYSENLVRQTINDRYKILKEIERDENGIAYLAEDTLIVEQKVVVKVLTNTEYEDSFAENIFAEERNSFAQIVHPNIVKVIETGELSNGKAYLVTEYVEGKSVKDYLQKNGQFTTLRTARIVRQAAEALDEAHQSGVLHRNIKPENIILSVDENGAERIKLTNFNFSKEKLNEENLLYKSPEQVEGKIANFKSDGFSLAVVAYQMLTNRLPFNASSVGDLLKSQREGLTLRPSDLRTDLPSSIDEVLEKALAFNAFERYSEVRDFGDDFFSEIIINAPLETEEDTEEAETISDVTAEEKPSFEPVLLAEDKTSTIIDDAGSPEDVIVKEDEDLIRNVKATENLAWEKRSPKPLDKANPNRSTASLAGVAALLAVLFGVWYYFINRPSEPVFVETPTETANQIPAADENPILANTAQNVAPTPDEVEPIPLARTISQPPDTEYFQNSKADLKGDAMKNFLGFSLYYPRDWKRNESKNNFLDAAKTGKDNLPVEQILVSYYNSKGTFKTDEETFPAQVKESNATLKKLLPDYKMISEGRKTVNNGWQAYEIKFQGTGKAANGDKITLWGKRLFIPTAIRGMKNGYVITMLATSLSKEVKNVDDVGVKGDLATVLETFEPNQNF